MSAYLQPSLSCYSLDLLEDARILSDSHAEKFLCAPILVQNIVCILPKFFHVCPHEHLTELHKVTVVLVIDFNHTPWVGTPTNFSSTRGLDDVVRTNDCEGDFAGNLFRFSNRFLILILVSRCLEYMDIMMGNVSENLAGPSFS